MHRVRVGAIGLACVFLLVMLATAFLHATSGGSAGANTTAAAENADATPSEPLAELGVAPGNVPPDAANNAAAPVQHPGQSR